MAGRHGVAFEAGRRSLLIAAATRASSGAGTGQRWCYTRREDAKKEMQSTSTQQQDVGVQYTVTLLQSCVKRHTKSTRVSREMFFVWI